MGGPHPLIAARGPAVALDAHLALTQFGKRADRLGGLVACDHPSVPGGILPDSTHERFESPAVEPLTCEMYGVDLSTQRLNGAWGKTPYKSHVVVDPASPVQGRQLGKLRGYARRRPPGPKDAVSMPAIQRYEVLLDARPKDAVSNGHLRVRRLGCDVQGALCLGDRFGPRADTTHPGPDSLHRGLYGRPPDQLLIRHHIGEACTDRSRTTRHRSSRWSARALPRAHAAT